MWSSKVQAHSKLSSSLLILLFPGDPAWPQSIPRLLGSDVRKLGVGALEPEKHTPSS